jgi:hypothetical protein
MDSRDIADTVALLRADIGKALDDHRIEVVGG